jgi:hypothetical protein
MKPVLHSSTKTPGKAVSAALRKLGESWMDMVRKLTAGRTEDQGVPTVRTAAMATADFEDFWYKDQ